MAKYLPTTRAHVLCLLLSTIIANNPTVHADPVFQTKQVVGVPNDFYQLTSFNDQDYVLGIDQNTGRSFVFYHGVNVPLPLQGAPEITAQGSFPLAMNNPDSNGVVRIVGGAFVSLTNADGSQPNERGACWFISPNTADAVTEITMPNFIWPPNEQFAGENVAGHAVAVNDAGAAVGADGFWSPIGYSYGNAQLGSFNNSGSADPTIVGVDGIDNLGNYLVDSWEWDHFLPSNRTSPLIGPSAGELPAVDSPHGTNAFPRAIHGGFVVGTYNVASSRGIFGTYSGAFVWNVGDARLTALPDPAGKSSLPSNASRALSVNNAGDVVGWVSFPFVAGGVSSFSFDVLWKRDSFGGYTAYTLDDILADQNLSFFEHVVDFIRINDNGEIALETRPFGNSEQDITIVAPAGGAITVSGPSPVDQKDKFELATVSLQRADGFTGPVSVQYGTSDGTAISGVRYTPVQGLLTWTNGDSSNKIISIPLISIHTGIPLEDFNFTLSNAVNATFGGFGAGSNLDVFVADDGGQFAFADTNNSVADSWTNVTLGIVRAGGTDGAATISFGTFDGTAAAGTDYTTTNGTLTWTSGDASKKEFTVQIANRGSNAPNANFNVFAFVQSADSGAAQVVASQSQALVTITRPGHPVSPTLKRITVTPAGFKLQLEATQGGKFLAEIANTPTWEHSILLNLFTNVIDAEVAQAFSTTNSTVVIRLRAQ